MRMLIVLMLSIAALAGTLALSPKLREQAADVLFHRKDTSPADSASTPDPDGAPASQNPLDTIGRAGDKAMGAIAELAAEAPQAVSVPGTAEPERTPAPVAAPVPEVPNPQAGPPTAQAAAQRIVLPRFLSSVRFGMSMAQIRKTYTISWQKQEAGEEVLVHYPVPDKSQMVHFHFRTDKLYQIRIFLKPAQGQTLKQLYDQHQQALLRQYRDVREARRTRWSDGTLQASIGQDQKLGYVEITYQEPALKR